MTFTYEQVQLITFALNKQREVSKQNAEDLAEKFHNGEFRGKGHGPQNFQQLNTLLGAFNREVKELTYLIRDFDKLAKELA